jgi:hypothetical protein
LSNAQWHNAIHGWGPNALGPAGRAVYGTPNWAKNLAADAVGRVIDRGLFAPRVIEVALELDEGRQLQTDDVKQVVIRALQKNRDFWESGSNIDEIVGSITRAKLNQRRLATAYSSVNPKNGDWNGVS